METKYTIYKIKNKINHKIYIGAHKTKDINDAYMGSGKILKKAQDKYGIENFTKEILAVFDNPEEMFEMESQLVNEDFVKDKSTYNLKEGGEGGWDHCNSDSNMQRSKGIRGHEAQRILTKTNPNWAAQRSKSISDGQKKSYLNGRVPHVTGLEFKGKRHTDETKKKISKANKKNQLGERNSQYGSMWICHDKLKQNKKIKKGDIIPAGWRRGRLLNKMLKG